MMKRLMLIILSLGIIFIIVSCRNHTEEGDRYLMEATKAVQKDSLIQAYSLTEKAAEEYRMGGAKSKENKALLFLSLLYFSTGQKDTAYQLIKDMEGNLTADEDYPFYSNYFRIKAYYMSLYGKDTPKAVALIDSVLHFDRLYAGDNTTLLNIDRLNKCEILLNDSQYQPIKGLIDSVISTTSFPSPLEPQIYANLARRFELEQQPDSAYKYALQVIDRTSKIHEDIDNNIFALEIILRYDSLNSNLSDYIRYRDHLDSLKEERQGERIKYRMAFVKEQNISETLRLKAQTEKRTLIWIAVSIFLAAVIILLILWQRHKETLIKNEMIQLECDRLDAEAFRRKFENELLHRKIDTTSDELAKANNEILELSQRLAYNERPVGSDETSYLGHLLESLKSNSPDFRQKIIGLYPDITKTELTVACLIRLNLSSQEMATALSISKSGLIKARYRLRKKLGLETAAELDKFITTL